MHIVYTKETRTDPADAELFVETEEVEELVIRSIVDDGELPTVVYGTDDYSEDEIELKVSDYLTANQIMVLKSYMDSEVSILSEDGLVAWLMDDVAAMVYQARLKGREEGYSDCEKEIERTSYGV